MSAPLPLFIAPFSFPTFLWGIFGLTLIVFCFYSLVLFYHWKTYGVGFQTGPFVSLIYLGVSSLFLFTMAASLALL